MSGAITSLIINSPYEMPGKYWKQDRYGRVFEIAEGRRPAGYEIFDTRHNTRRVVEL